MEPENSGQLDKNILSSSNVKFNYSRSKQNVNDDSIIIYKPFSSNKLEESYLGISIQKERIYVVQKKVISIFQYYPPTPFASSLQKQKESSEKANNLQNSDFRLPILTKEIILPFQITNFTITDKYICVRSKTKTQIRDSQFQTVYFTHDKELNKIDPKKCEDQKNSQNNSKNQQNKSNKSPLNNKNNKKQASNWADTDIEQEKTVQQLDYCSHIQNDYYIVWKQIIKWGKLKNPPPKLSSFGFWAQYHHQKMNILTRQKSTTLCKSETIGDHNMLETYLKSDGRNLMSNNKSPIFINQLGYIQNFYIWQRSLNTIQIGIQFNKKSALQSEKKCAQNALYQIASIQLKGILIQKIFHYNSLDDKRSKELNTQKMFKKIKKEDGPHLFLAIGKQSNQTNGSVKIIAFQVLPEHKIPNQQENESFNQALNQYIDHFTQLSKQKSKLQHSISNNLLLNELMSQTQIPSKILSKQKKQSQTSEISNKSALLVENLVLKDCIGLSNTFYNPDSKILWIGDKSSKIFKIHLMNEDQLLNCKFSKSEQSIFKKIQCFKSPSECSELSGIIYDKYPIYKNKVEKTGQQPRFSLQIGLTRIESVNNYDLKQQIIKNERKSEILDSNNDENKETIEVDDNQLQKIGRQVKLRQRNAKKDNYQQENSNTKYRLRESQIKQSNLIVKKYTETQVQTQQIFSAKQQITYTSATDMLKELNFQKVQDVLIRFSNLFVSSVTKNINKLKQINTKSKEQIKQKIGNDIYDIVSQIFQPQLNNVLSQKLEKQILKSRQFIQKLYSKQLQHFNLLILQQKVKQQDYFKKIVQQQLRSIEIIKQTSLKFLDINKIRQMQKIAYSQIVIQNIKQVGNNISQLYQKVNDVERKSAEIQRQIFQEIKEIKEIFKLLIQQNQDQKDKNHNQNQDEKNFNASYQQSISSQNSQTSSETDSDSEIDSSCCENQKFIQQQMYQSFGPKNNYLSQNFQPMNPPQFYSYPPYYQESNNYGAPIHMNRNFNNQYSQSYVPSPLMRQNPPSYIQSYQSHPYTPPPPPQMNNFSSNYPGYNVQNNIPYQNNSSIYPPSQNYPFQKQGMVQYEQRNFHNHQNSNNFYPNPNPNFNQIKKQELKAANKVSNQKKDKKSKKFKNSSSIKNN